MMSQGATLSVFSMDRLDPKKRATASKIAIKGANCPSRISSGIGSDSDLMVKMMDPKFQYTGVMRRDENVWEYRKYHLRIASNVALTRRRLGRTKIGRSRP